MSKQKKQSLCLPVSGCQVEAIVTVDERGQMVLPKEVRERANIKAGDKLAVISCESDGKLCCLSLVKGNDFADAIKQFLGPAMKGLLKGST